MAFLIMKKYERKGKIVMKEYDEKSTLDKVTDHVSRGMKNMGKDFAGGVGIVTSFVATQAALDTTVQWAQGLEDRGNILENFKRLDWENKTALGGGGYAAIKTVANVLGEVKDRAGEVIEKTNQQLETGTLTKSFSGTTLFELDKEKR